MANDDTPTVSLESEGEIDWFAMGRNDVAGADAVHEVNVQGSKALLQGRRVDAADQQEIDDTYSSFTDAVNMSPSDLRDWSDHDCSDKASVKPGEVRQRVIGLLETAKEDWGEQEVRDANRVISFVSRMRGMEQGDGTEDCPSDRDISLMNWGYRPDGVSL